jgi:hypothetical protein
MQRKNLLFVSGPNIPNPENDSKTCREKQGLEQGNQFYSTKLEKDAPTE